MIVLLEAARQVALVVGASLFVALCAHVTVPLIPLTPVPLTVQNLAVLLVGLLLGSRRGFAALALYLIEGASGLPVFNPTGPGGIAQLLGPTGGFLMVYPLVAFLAGFLFERGAKTFLRAAIGRSGRGDFALRGRIDLALCIYSFAGQGRVSRPLLLRRRRSHESDVRRRDCGPLAPLRGEVAVTR